MNNIAFIIVKLLLIIKITQQSTPIYNTSQYFYSNGAQVKNYQPRNATDFTFSIPTTFPISTASHRQPFHAITCFSNFRFVSNTDMYFWTQIKQYTATSFRFAIYFWATYNNGTLTDNHGITIDSFIAFRYLLVKNTFPQVYISTTLYLTVPANLTSNTPVQNTFTKTSFSNSTALSFSNDTVYIHSFVDASLTSTKTSPDNSFQLDISFLSVNVTSFRVIVSGIFPLVIGQLQIKVFIFNKADFVNFYIKYEYQKISFSNLTTYSLLNDVNTINPFNVNDLVYGISSFEFQGSDRIGFNATISNASYSQFRLNLLNIKSNSSIPNLKIFIFYVVQFQCPYGQLLVNQALNNCYNTTCPIDHYLSTQQVGNTGISVCKSCTNYDPNCNRCSSTNCTSCMIGYNLNYNGSICGLIPRYPTNQTIDLMESKVLDNQKMTHNLLFKNGFSPNITQTDIKNQIQIYFKFTYQGTVYRQLIPINQALFSPNGYNVQIQTPNIFAGDPQFSNSQFEINYTSNLLDKNNSYYVSSSSYYPLIGSAFLKSYYDTTKNKSYPYLGNILCLITFIILLITVFIKIKYDEQKQYNQVMSFLMSIYCLGFIRMKIYKFPILDYIQIITGFSYFELNFMQGIFSPPYQSQNAVQNSLLPIKLAYDNQSFLSSAGNSFIAFCIAQFLLLIYFIKVYFTNKEYRIFNILQQLVIGYFLLKFQYSSIINFSSLTINQLKQNQQLYLVSLIISLSVFSAILTYFVLKVVKSTSQQLKKQIYKFHNFIRIIFICSLVSHTFIGFILVNVLEIIAVGVNVYFVLDLKINKYLYGTQSLAIIIAFNCAFFIESSISLIISLALTMYGIWIVKVYYIYKFFNQSHPNKVKNTNQINQKQISSSRSKSKNKPKPKNTLQITDDQLIDKYNYKNYQSDLKNIHSDVSYLDKDIKNLDSDRKNQNHQNLQDINKTLQTVIKKRPQSAISFITQQGYNYNRPGSALLYQSTDSLKQSLQLIPNKNVQIQDGIQSIDLQVKPPKQTKQSIILQNDHLNQNIESNPINSINMEDLRRKKKHKKRQKIGISNMPLQ